MDWCWPVTHRKLQCMLWNREEELNVGNSLWRRSLGKGLGGFAVRVVKQRDYSGSRDSGRLERRAVPPVTPNPLCPALNSMRIDARLGQCALMRLTWGLMKPPTPTPIDQRDMVRTAGVALLCSLGIY